MATALGIGNGKLIQLLSFPVLIRPGIWVFGPAFKEQQQEKADQTK